MNKTTKILIVDDSTIARETLVDLLASDNHEFRHAENGIVLFSVLDDYEPDVILLDVMMPGLDGYEVCRQLKGDPQWQHIPIILVTALDSREALIEGLDAGADEFLSKPINGAVLRARVRSMLRIKHQYDELQKVIELRENLAALIVHDMRSPLATIILYLELMLRRGRLPDEENSKTRRVLGEARRLDVFINDMLMMAKVEEDKLLLYRQEHDLVEFVKQRVNDFEALASPRNITLSVSLPDAPILFKFDTSLLSRALDNLVNNALKSSPSPGNICISLSAATDGKLATLTIADQGYRIPEEHWDDIFDVLSIAHLKQKGVTRVGLPLAFTNMIISAHGGEISIQNNEPAGTVFTISF